jgi:hypothetical protein
MLGLRGYVREPYPGLSEQRLAGGFFMRGW